MKLETQRLILRKPKESDWKDIYEGVKEFDVAKRTEGIPHPYKKQDAKDWLKKSIKKNNKKECYTFFLELKKEKKVIGVLELIKINKTFGTAETGSWLNKKYWRKAYMTEAKIAVNNFVFNKLKIRKLNTGAFSDNKASNATQKRMGYKIEGVKIKDRRDAATKRLHDLNMYGLFKTDWNKNLPRLKKHLENKIKKFEK